MKEVTDREQELSQHELEQAKLRFKRGHRDMASKAEKRQRLVETINE